VHPYSIMWESFRSLLLSLLHVGTTVVVTVFTYYLHHVQATFPQALRHSSGLDNGIIPGVKRVSAGGGHDVSSQDRLLPGSVNGDGSPNGAYSASPTSVSAMRENGVSGYRSSVILQRDDLHGGILKYGHGGTAASLIQEEEDTGDLYIDDPDRSASAYKNEHLPSSPLVSIV
jgi:hypothetical protein